MTKFPLDYPPFPPLHLIQSDKETLLELTDQLLLEMIADYLNFYNGFVDPTLWVRLKQFEDVVVYEDRQVLKDRRLSRNLDDIMYAAVNHGDEDAKLHAAYVESNAIDSAILSTLVYPTVSDPFRGVITTLGTPELHEFKLVRGNMTLCHFFRHKKSHGVVETFVKTFIDLMGDMPLRVATTLAISEVVSVWKLGE
ncbi:hypothetical protein PHMEG_00014878 [Phytophthora megakarya]|uniref:Uncharacterized protein n=1 Tax=Phytophthora megakarya TaxID=4795 RepID=A0A225W370_9STRA|nr:hypothetical protein PHMEG_00014878 [Phytophthora megakarya]